MAAVGAVSPISSSEGGNSIELIRQAMGLIPRGKNQGGESSENAAAKKKTSPASGDAGKVQAGSKSGQSNSTDTNGLDKQKQAELQKLQAVDREVRAHEQAHMAAGGNLVTSGPTYSYKNGPDGNMYAVAGEVGIDTSPVRGDPAATIRKEQQVRQAALAPADPSSQDERVAAAASKTENDARLELAQQKYNQGKTQQNVATTTNTVNA